MSWKGTLRSLGASARRSEREALRRHRELERQHKQLEKMQEIERAAYEVAVYENLIEVLVSVYKDSGEIWDWEKVRSSDPPTKPLKSNVRETNAQRVLESYNPGFMDKILRREESKRNQLTAAVREGRDKDEQEYQDALKNFEVEYVEWETTQALASRILSGDIDAFIDAIKQTNPFSEISHLGSSIELRMENRELMEATLHVKGEDVIPTEIKTLLKSGKLSIKSMPKTKFYELYQDYVCGGVLRVARELFALLPINMVIVTAVGELLNTQTGYMQEQPILSIAIPKETLDKLNFEMLDPSDSMTNFVHKMNYSKTKGFQPIEKILPTDLSSS